jgi:hypothetical protein
MDGTAMGSGMTLTHQRRLTWLDGIAAAIGIVALIVVAVFVSLLLHTSLHAWTGWQTLLVAALSLPGLLSTYAFGQHRHALHRAGHKSAAAFASSAIQVAAVFGMLAFVVPVFVEFWMWA